jgi:ribosomal protein S27AE
VDRVSDYEKTCPHCGKSLMTRDEEGNLHLLTRLTTFRTDGKAIGKCPQCKRGVEIPVRLAPTIRHVITK